ncbi:MAG: M6 family metalloprotease domain-containing protein [Muribaculaceae bacterium]|jgi:immune inhibitor A|nr:M6 family metalloprotease domain-containing protein [Muribaculaceae bacterium]
MKKSIFLAIALAIFGFTTAFAVPACPQPVKVTQPDGSSLTISLVGDEFMHYNTTLDGYTVVKRSDGSYVYAALSNGAVVPSNVVAHDAFKRTASEKSYLWSVSKNMRPSVNTSKMSRRLRDAGLIGTAKPKVYDYKHFHGLIIMVNFNDRKFSRTDAHAVFDSIVNGHNFKGFKDAEKDSIIPYSGSVCDYFRDNSMGMFNPKFDVAGPVDINYSCTYPHSTDSISQVIKATLAAADSSVNYADYDVNGDGAVDMLYFIFAGFGSNFSGNNSGYVWPHAFYINNFAPELTLDGVTFGRYACSTELFGWENDIHYIDGIGTVCHEFSHVLGLPDLYDTDYTGSGGQSIFPKSWTIMANGSYLNKARTPCGYGLLERFLAGFTMPQTISSQGSYSLEPINTSNAGYKINSGQDSVCFLLENRQLTGWDQYLKGHGMLVFRADTTNMDVWYDNTINCDPSHDYYVLVRANCQYDTTGTWLDSAYDPFPGTGNVTSINNDSIEPNLRSWSGKNCPFVISGIKEDNGVISFNVDPATTAVAAVKASSLSLSAVRSGNVLTVTTSDSASPVSLYRADGVLLNRVKVVGSADFTLPFHGLFIVNQGNVSRKIMF